MSWSFFYPFALHLSCSHLLSALSRPSTSLVRPFRFRAPKQVRLLPILPSSLPLPRLSPVARALCPAPTRVRHRGLCVEPDRCLSSPPSFSPSSPRSPARPLGVGETAVAETRAAKDHVAAAKAAKAEAKKKQQKQRKREGRATRCRDGSGSWAARRP